MAHTMAILTNSNFYSPSLNGAIFDGPFKIYFSQDQETLGLATYFNLQNKLGSLYEDFKRSFKNTKTNIFIMIYPHADVYQSYCSNHIQGDGFFQSSLQNNLVLGVTEDVPDSIYVYIKDYLNQLSRKELESIDLDPIIA